MRTIWKKIYIDFSNYDFGFDKDNAELAIKRKNENTNHRSNLSRNCGRTRLEKA